MATLLNRERLKCWENEGLAAYSLFLGQAHSACVFLNPPDKRDGCWQSS